MAAGKDLHKLELELTKIWPTNRITVTILSMIGFTDIINTHSCSFKYHLDQII